MKKPAQQHEIEPKVMNRLRRLESLIDEDYDQSPAEFERKTGIKMAQVSQWFTGYRALRDKALKRLEESTGKPEGWFDQPASNSLDDQDTGQSVAQQANLPSNRQRNSGLVRIDQFDAGGGMGRSRVVLHEQPGAIKSWVVDKDWVRLNVKGYTSIDNLKIVTGFGPSMKPMFNPGDPLLVDVGVTHVDHEGVYFYRIGDDGYIKTLHRVPQEGGGRLLIARSKNVADYPDPITINEKTMDFHVLAKVLTVWKSEQY